jgi:hypothetical protein
MTRDQNVTIREFLRNFKEFKDSLLNGNVMHVLINVGNGERLKVEREPKGLTGKELVRRIRSLNKPIRIERPDIFEGFLERIEKRKKDSRKKRSTRKK